VVPHPAELCRELERVASEGFAISRREWREAVHGLASVVRDRTANAVAAISISGPAYRLPLRT
jgi:IclR family KDG regulon transcriptional repressor